MLNISGFKLADPVESVKVRQGIIILASTASMFPFRMVVTRSIKDHVKTLLQLFIANMILITDEMELGLRTSLSSVQILTTWH